MKDAFYFLLEKMNMIVDIKAFYLNDFIRLFMTNNSSEQYVLVPIGMMTDFWILKVEQDIPIYHHDNAFS
jgi:hypothetical protein